MSNDNPIPIATGVAIPLAEVELKASRSSGPGGQHANVTASRIEAVFDVEASATLSDDQKRRIVDRLGDRVTAVSQDSRSQVRNRELALERLAERLKNALEVPRARKPTKPSRKARQKRLKGKRLRGLLKRSRRRPQSNGDD